MYAWREMNDMHVSKADSDVWQQLEMHLVNRLLALRVVNCEERCLGLE